MSHLKIWENAIHILILVHFIVVLSFIQSMVAYYYPSDSEVSADSELQEWINEIFYYGFLGNDDSGIYIFVVICSFQNVYM